MARLTATRPLSLIMASALLASCAAEEPPPAATGAAPDLVEKALKVPGFADFIAIDGDTAWVTNDGRVEQWSATEKVASFAVPRPCGTMAIAEGSLWVANCPGAEIYRINLKTATLEA
ncbi:MAG: YncE family protein, partial [Erythrobacter sp.]|nr:YncE family protein [Erythrobacter sp.]